MARIASHQAFEGPKVLYLSVSARAMIGLLSGLYFTVPQKFLFIFKMLLKKNETYLKGKDAKEGKEQHSETDIPHIWQSKP